MFGFRFFIVRFSLLLFSVFFVGSSVSADQDEKRTGFFATDLIGEFILIGNNLYHGTALDIKFGSQLAPQHTLEFGIRLPHRSPEVTGRQSIQYSGAILLKYSYDFIKNDEWIRELAPL